MPATRDVREVDPVAGGDEVPTSHVEERKEREEGDEVILRRSVRREGFLGGLGKSEIVLNEGRRREFLEFGTEML